MTGIIRITPRSHEFTWPIITPVAAGGGGNDSHTRLLLHFDGTNGSTTFTDSGIGTGTPHTQTRNGSAVIDTSQSKFGGASVRLTASSHDIVDSDSSSDDANFRFLSPADFTIDMWVRIASTTGGVYQILWDQRTHTGGGGVGMQIGLEPNHAFAFYINSSGGTGGTFGGGTPNLNQWYHVAWVRSSGTSTLYVDGTAVGTPYSDTNDYRSYYGPRIGGWSNSDSSLSFDGWIDEVRLSDVARWTTNFTPPTAAYS